MTAHRPEGWPAVIPRVVTDDVSGVVEFVKSVFGARGDLCTGRPTELWLDGSLVMVSDGGGVRQALPTFLYVYVPDVEAVVARAAAQGATVVEPPTDLPYGDRRATLRDRWDNTWQVATRLPA